MDNIIIKVGYSDTLETIAKRYNVTPAIISSCNLSVKEVEEGDMLVIPYQARAIHVVRPLETLKEIADKYLTTTDKIKADNKISAPLFIGQQLLIL